MCKVIKNILGKDSDVSKNRGGWDEVGIKESSALDGRGRPITYLQHTKGKRTPKEIIKEINEKSKR